MPKSFRVLILEDSPADAELVQYELQEGGLTFTSKVVTTAKDFANELQEFPPDLILSDYDLPQYNGALALAEARKRCPDIPFILVTGAVGEDRAIEILTQGAKDYVLKSRLQRLVPAVQRALTEAGEHRARKAAEEELLESHKILESLLEERNVALRESGELYRSLFDNMLNGFAYCRMLFDQERPQDFICLDVNKAFEALTGVTDAVGKKVSEVIPGIQTLDADLFEFFGRVALTGKPNRFEKYFESLKMWFAISVFSPKKEHFVAVFDVITERKLLEEAQLFLLQRSYPDDNFFASLSRYLAQILEIDYVGIYRLQDDSLIAKAVAVFSDGKLEDNAEYSLPDTPCGDVAGNGICCFPRNVRQLFPQDVLLQKIGAEGYIGTTLWNSKGQPIGLIVLLSRAPLFNTRLVEAILKLVALRTAGELERKHLEEERYQSERHYSLLHDTMLQGVVYQDAGGKVISMNPAAVQILGQSPEEALWHTTGDNENATLRADGSFLPISAHPSIIALRTGKELRDVVMGVYNRREKRYCWINVRAVPLFRPGADKPDQVYIIFDDITERRRIEITLQESEVRYRRLFEAAQEGILIVDAETGQIFDVNPYLMEMLDYSKEEITGKRLWELRAFKDIPKSKKTFTELQHSRYIRDDELQLETKNGILIDVEFVSSVYMVDNTKVIQCNIRDITKRKQAERRQLLWAKLMGIVNESRSLVNAIGSILNAIKEAMGFGAVGIRLRTGDDFPYFAHNGFSPDFLLTENMLAAHDQEGGVCRDKNGAIPLECYCGLVISGQTDPANNLFTPGGSFWTNDSRPLLDLLPNHDPRFRKRNRCIQEGFRSVALIPIRANQEIVGLLQLNDRKKGCFTPDMINFFEGLGLSIGIALIRQQAEEAIIERTSQLEAANNELESFAYSISHDLRAPLRAINGFSRMLARDLKDKLDEESMRRLDTVRKNGMKMNQLIDDVLSFSRLSQESLAMTVIHMENLAADVWNELQENNPQGNITINIDHLVPCYGDHKMIRRVLTNLLSNAAKFTNKRQDALVEVGSYEKEHEYVYFVKDNGSGFDAQYSDKLFRLFQRLHSDADYEGTGAGLSIVKRIIERHNGRVWAEGKVDEGATFYFTLPK